jgi:MFS family permease
LTDRTASLWRHRAFLNLWAAQTVSSFGARIAREGLPMIAVKLLAAGPLAMGLLSALGLAAYGLVAMVAGPLADRLPRRALLIGADLGRAAVMLAIPVAAILGRITFVEVCAALVLMSALTVVFDTADHAFLPGVVEPAQLVDANAKLGATDAIGEVGGPAVAGVLFSVLAAPIAVVVTAATYLGSAAFLAAVPPQQAQHSGEETPPAFDPTAGLRLVLAHPAVRPLWAADVARTFFGWFYGALYLLYAVRDLHLTLWMQGLTVGMGGVGALVGAALAPRIGRALGPGPMIIGSGVLASVFGFLIPLAAGPPFVAMVMLMAAQFFGDALGTVSEIGSVSYRQQAFPPDALGRAVSAFGTGLGFAGVAGSLTGGALALIIGARGALFIASAGITAASLIPLASPAWRTRGGPRAAAPQA